MELKQKIQTEFIGANNLGIERTTEKLTELVGKQARCYDSCIDDGADGDETEDSYVMKDCYEFEGSNLRVRIYYGDVTREIGYVDVTED